MQTARRRKCDSTPLGAPTVMPGVGHASNTSAGHPAAFVAWLVAERVVRLMVATVVLAVVARYLQPHGFGELNFALSIVGMTMPLALLGLETIVVRELVRTPERSGELLGTAFVARLGAGFVCCAALLLMAANHPELFGPIAVLGPLSFVLILQAGETPDLWFRRHVQSHAAVIARTGAILAGAVAKLILIALGAGVHLFAWVVTAEIALFGIGLAAVYFRTKGHPAPWRWNAVIARELLRASWGPAVAGLLGAIAFRIDQFFIGTMLGAEPLGIYFAALRLIEVPAFLSITVTAALFPALVAAKTNAQSDALTLLFAVNAALAWLTALACTLVAPWLVPLVFGRAYAAAWPALIVQAWATLPYFVAIVRSQLLVLHNQPGVQSIIGMITLATQVIFNAALIPRWGITGAAVAFLLTQAINAWLLPVLLPPLRETAGPQLRGLLLPLQPAAWPRLLAAFRKERVT